LLDNLPHGFDTSAMASYSWQSTACGPAAISVHDDRDVQAVL
jgi:hypothetical protein